MSRGETVDFPFDGGSSGGRGSGFEQLTVDLSGLIGGAIPAQLACAKESFLDHAGPQHRVACEGAKGLGDVGDAGGLDEEGGAAGYFGHGGAVGGDDGASAGHRLGDGHAPAFLDGGMAEAEGAAVQGDQVAFRHGRDDVDAVVSASLPGELLERGSFVAESLDDDEVRVRGVWEGIEKGEDGVPLVLVGGGASDDQDVLSGTRGMALLGDADGLVVGWIVGGCELGVDAMGDGCAAGGRLGVMGDDLVSRGLADGDDVVGASDGSLNSIAVEPGLHVAPESFCAAEAWVREPHDVVDRHQRSHGESGGQGVEGSVEEVDARQVHSARKHEQGFGSVCFEGDRDFS
ncbi:MAG: hypothetical protein U1E22_08205, partial [Coriobacteriia bacterium]|nr:hypothetical protein [Coriobacteriia bacterium]